jgi:hypothetical protein
MPRRDDDDYLLDEIGPCAGITREVDDIAGVIVGLAKGTCHVVHICLWQLGKEWRAAEQPAWFSRAAEECFDDDRFNWRSTSFPDCLAPQHHMLTKHFACLKATACRAQDRAPIQYKASRTVYNGISGHHGSVVYSPMGTLAKIEQLGQSIQTRFSHPVKVAHPVQLPTFPAVPRWNGSIQ